MLDLNEEEEQLSVASRRSSPPAHHESSSSVVQQRPDEGVISIECVQDPVEAEEDEGVRDVRDREKEKIMRLRTVKEVAFVSRLRYTSYERLVNELVRLDGECSRKKEFEAVHSVLCKVVHEELLVLGLGELGEYQANGNLFRAPRRRAIEGKRARLCLEIIVNVFADVEHGKLLVDLAELLGALTVLCRGDKAENFAIYMRTVLKKNDILEETGPLSRDESGCHGSGKKPNRSSAIGGVKCGRLLGLRGVLKLILTFANLKDFMQEESEFSCGQIAQCINRQLDRMHERSREYHSQS